MAVTALIRAGLVRSPRVTGVNVPHKVPDFMFMTPAKHWADEVDAVSRDGGRMGVPLEILPAGGAGLLMGWDTPTVTFLLTMTDGFDAADHVGVTWF